MSVLCLPMKISKIWFYGGTRERLFKLGLAHILLELQESRNWKQNLRLNLVNHEASDSLFYRKGSFYRLHRLSLTGQPGLPVAFDGVVPYEVNRRGELNPNTTYTEIC